MSFLKNWKLILASLSLALFTACAGSSGGGSDEGGAEGGAAGGASGKAAVQKEKIDENKLKKTEDEAMAMTEENHKLRKEIFDAKNKLGIPVERPDAE
ncbi:MAG: hypothetical protein IKB43_11800 [Fibrobacter sp.]|nr:hypothetical protein [Fibrobacter sp.]MBR2470808.1 hypothetical protein [Fibrobacter sp.]